MRPAWGEHQCFYVTVDKRAQSDVQGEPFYTIKDGNRDTKLSLVFMALKILFLLVWIRPHYVISTGAAPGYFACRFAKFVRARSLFIDSVANAEDMSLSAKLATSHADKVFSQWPDVATRHNVEYHGNIL